MELRDYVNIAVVAEHQQWKGFQCYKCKNDSDPPKQTESPTSRNPFELLETPFNAYNTPFPPSKAKSTRKLEPASTSLELEPTSTTSSTALPEKELLPPRPLSKRTSMERLPLLFRVVGIVTPVKPRSQLRVTEHFIRLIDVCHLFRRLLFSYSQGACLVGVVLFGHCSVGLFDCAIVSIRGDA